MNNSKVTDPEVIAIHAIVESSRALVLAADSEDDSVDLAALVIDHLGRIDDLGKVCATTVTEMAAEPCESCLRPAGVKNHVPGHVFVGWGQGWQVCPVCKGSMVKPVPVSVEGLLRQIERVAVAELRRSSGNADDAPTVFLIGEAVRAIDVARKSGGGEVHKSVVMIVREINASDEYSVRCEWANRYGWFRPGDLERVDSKFAGDAKDTFTLTLAAQKREIELLRAAVLSLGEEIANEYPKHSPGHDALAAIDKELGRWELGR